MLARRSPVAKHNAWKVQSLVPRLGPPSRHRIYCVPFVMAGIEGTSWTPLALAFHSPWPANASAALRRLLNFLGNPFFLPDREESAKEASRRFHRSDDRDFGEGGTHGETEEERDKQGRTKRGRSKKERSAEREGGWYIVETHITGKTLRVTWLTVGNGSRCRKRVSPEDEGLAVSLGSILQRVPCSLVALSLGEDERASVR